MECQLFMNLLIEVEEYSLDIHTSASIGCDERVRDIIENSESKSVVDEQNKIGWTPLMYASYCANLKVVFLLLEEGANTNLKNADGHTALILASKCGTTDVVNLLIDNGANVNEKDFKGWTALFHAVAFGHRHVIQLLIEKGAFIDMMDNDANCSPILLASAAGHEMIVKDLLQFGANPHMKSKLGDTASSLAMKNGHMKIKRLIDEYLFPKKKNHSSQLCFPDLFSLLNELQLTKYYNVFESEGIDLNTFWLLSDDDLKKIGIHLLGPRKKLCMIISQYNQNQLQKNAQKTTMNIDVILNENKKLQQMTETFKAMVFHEKNLKTAAENNLRDGIETLRNYADTVQCTVAQAIQVLEKIKENHIYLKNYFCSVLGSTHYTNIPKSKIDIIFQIFDSLQKYTDVEYQHMISLQLADFKK